MRGLVFVSSEGDVIRFLRNRPFDRVMSQHAIEYIFPDGPDYPAFPVSSADIGGRPATWLDVGVGRYRRWNDLFTLSGFAYASRSDSFRIRSVGLYRGRWPSIRLLTRSPRDFLRYFWRILLFLQKQPLYYALKLASLPPFYRAFRAWTIARQGRSPAVESLLDAKKPDFVLLPTSLHEYFIHDVILSAQARNIPTIALQGNWDNVSSKGILFFHPDILGVWGEQARGEAMAVQEFSPESLQVLGAAQFESFRRPSSIARDKFLEAAGLPLDRPMIVFAGNARGFDEIAALQDLEAAMDEGRLEKASVIYRPHPWSGKNGHRLFRERQWRYSILDPDTAEAVKPREKGVIADESNNVPNFYYGFDYLNTLYSHAAAMVVPYSTAILECMIKGVPIVTIAYSDDDSHWGPDLTAQMRHCVDLWDIPGIFRCDRRSDLPRHVAAALVFHANPVARDKLRNASRYFVDFSDRPYADRLLDIVDNIIKEKASR